MYLKFLGAATTVTGSKYLLHDNKSRLLIDCGLFQGLKTLRLKNWADFDLDPKTLNAVLLTHAHLDHSGFIPRLVKLGYKGPIFCTPATKALCEILLPDSGFLLEEEARYANLKGYSKHHPALPLYSEAEARESLAQLIPITPEKEFNPIPGVSVKFRGAGHILGASSIYVKWYNKKILFSGDIGRQQDPIMPAPRDIEKDIDCFVTESTYGNRRHLNVDPADDLERVLNQTLQSGGTVVIPAFAVGRTQLLMYYIDKLRKSGRIPNVPIYLNSPMAISVTGLYCELSSQHKLSEKEVYEVCDGIQYINSENASRELNTKKGPMIIIAGSGMATGGRVLHHIKTFAPHSQNLLLFVGYQAAGTRGATIVGGAETVKIHGTQIPIKCRVLNLDYLSAHADFLEITDWIKKTSPSPGKVFITHGEPSASDALRRHLFDTFKWECYVPDLGAEYEL